ncbi:MULTISPECIES: choline-sulfatase [Roseobacteraceae]|uniref:Choline-sulfatase n=1 Tax=Pseudosulfitobacter pseudonitzschiae TaxID=1402135 RepID=A0A221K7N7_9RHOB|nr:MULTISPECIES: choline-sulfatase [Roseobacteraceae]ASM75014.1 choline-sulfatase [Pseudosulfitobacter pseudonitzschiae]
MKRPNILFVMADQMSAKALPFYGNPTVKAETLSRIAREGLIFEQAYCNSPLCGPSRLSMMSGQSPHKVGAYDNAPEFSSAIPTFAHYLRLGGYRTCLSGKMHFAGPDQLHGYEERLTTDIYPSDFGWTPNWTDREAKVRFQDMQNVIETGPCLRSLQIDYDDDVNIQAERWLYDRARERSDQPFMLTVSFTSPHDPYVARPEFWDLYSDADIDLPRVQPLAPDEWDAHSARIYDHYSVGEADVSDDVIRRMRHGYYASIEYIDSKLKVLMRVLEETGLDEDTIVIFASDHGDMMGERGLYYKKCFFEWAMRVPLIVWAPGRFAAGRVDTPVSLLDILPTFADLAGTLPDVLETDGHSLLPLLQGMTFPERVIPAEYLAEGIFEPTFMLRHRRYKLFYAENDPPLLFDMQEDPLELRNLAQNAAASAVLEELLSFARQTWDCGQIKANIIKDQNRRRLIETAHRKGVYPKWDWQPFTDATQQYVRAGKWTVEVEAGAHLDLRKS